MKPHHPSSGPTPHPASPSRTPSPLKSRAEYMQVLRGAPAKVAGEIDQGKKPSKEEIEQAALGLIAHYIEKTVQNTEPHLQTALHNLEKVRRAEQAAQRPSVQQLEAEPSRKPIVTREGMLARMKKKFGL